MPSLVDTVLRHIVPRGGPPAPKRIALVAALVVGLALVGAGLVLGEDRRVGSAERRAEAVLTALTAGDPLLHRVQEGLRSSPVAFVPNVGQWAAASLFVARKGPLSVHAFAGSFGVVLARLDAAGTGLAELRAPAPAVPRPARLEATALRFRFESSRSETRPEGRGPLPTRFHYFLGADPARWRAGVTGYARLWYPELYEGVDLALHCDGGDFEYDLRLAPGANLDAVDVRVEGAIAPLRLDADGALVVVTRLGPLRQTRPQAFEVTDLGPRPVDCAFELLAPDRFRFRLACDTRSTSRVIDPQLQYSTYLGGGSWDEVFAVSESDGEAVIAGRTFSLDFPTQRALQSTLVGISDVFVARLPLTGGPLVYSTYLGGSSDDEARGLTVDASGAPVVVGAAGSPDFPLQNAFQTRHAGNLDAFVARLSPSGGALVYSTYFGGSGVDAAVGVVLDAGGAAVLVGGTSSADFPTQGAFQPNHGGSFDAFVARLPLTGAPPTHSTYLGGSLDDSAVGVALDAGGAAVTAGFTASVDFPLRAAFQQAHGGALDAFVARFPRASGPPSCSTYLGGAADDLAYKVTVDASGAAVVAGLTRSADFPTRNAFQPGLAGLADAFVTCLPLSGAPPRLSTFLGGTSTDGALALALDARGEVVVAGWTYSSDFPVHDAFQPAHAGFADVFVTRLSLAGGPPTYSTYLGGRGLDKPYAVVIDASGAALVVGLTDSTNFPTRNPVQSTFKGLYDVFVTCLDLLPPGVFSYGGSTRGCSGALPIGASSRPRVGNASFAVTCERAPAGSTGLLGLSGRGLATPLVVLGAAIWIDPAAPAFVLAPAHSSASGASAVPLPVPPDAGLVGARVFAQFYWSDACAAGGVSASNAVQITVQP